MVFKKIHKKHCQKHVQVDFPLILTDLNKHLTYYKYVSRLWSSFYSQLWFLYLSLFV